METLRVIFWLAVFILVGVFFYGIGAYFMLHAGVAFWIKATIGIGAGALLASLPGALFAS